MMWLFCRVHMLLAVILLLYGFVWVFSGTSVTTASKQPIPVSARQNPSSYQPAHTSGGWVAPSTRSSGSSSSGGYSPGK